MPEQNSRASTPPPSSSSSPFSPIHSIPSLITYTSPTSPSVCLQVLEIIIQRSQVAEFSCLFSNGDQEIENLAAACVERAPLFHRWYSHTAGKRTFAFLMDDGYVYFTIADERLGNQGILQFLKHVKDEFKKMARKYPKEIMSGSRPVRLQEKFTPILVRLITLQESVSESGIIWPAGTPSPLHGPMEAPYPTNAPLLGKPSEKKKSRDHHVSRRDVELEERRKSTDKSVKVDLTSFEADNRGIHGSASPLPKDYRTLKRSGSQIIRANWCRQVRIVLAIDALICVILLVIWLFICHGIECVQ